MKVVSNTSPLIFLSNVDSLNLLPSCFGQVYIPEEVKSEFGNDELSNAVKVKQISSKGMSLVDLQYGALHRGELEAIQLACEIKADLILLDDLLARKKATMEQIKVMGTLGVFLTASYNGYISAREAIEKIDVLTNEYDMFIASNLLQSIKQELKKIH
jgi:predicted nucleic acid-binding protein